MQVILKKIDLYIKKNYIIEIVTKRCLYFIEKYE